ncbi:FxsA family protein [Bartonella sp. DGB2]|uniref:FxsA family protein n=1 Tax=Bartonella sp. DGB2 TaxID=3388426 RepID=UPI003990222A
MQKFYSPKSGRLGIGLFAILLVEISGFILVAKYIGFLATLALIIATTLLGRLLLRYGGLALLRDTQQDLAAGRLPERRMAHQTLLIIAAIILIIPGFVSDIFALFLLIPWVRESIFRFFQKHIVIINNQTEKEPSIIDLDKNQYQVCDPHAPEASPNSSNKKEPPDGNEAK